MSKWVLVETVSMFRVRYMVEASEDHPEYALDTVTMNHAKVFGAEHLGETIVSHRQMTEAEALALCDIDNHYCKSWDDQRKIDAFFTLEKDLDA